jgi:hypothetical protein
MHTTWLRSSKFFLRLNVFFKNVWTIYHLHLHGYLKYGLDDVFCLARKHHPTSTRRFSMPPNTALQTPQRCPRKQLYLQRWKHEPGFQVGSPARELSSAFHVGSPSLFTREKENKHTKLTTGTPNSRIFFCNSAINQRVCSLHSF